MYTLLLTQIREICLIKNITYDSIANDFHLEKRWFEDSINLNDKQISYRILERIYIFLKAATSIPINNLELREYICMDRFINDIKNRLEKENYNITDSEIVDKIGISHITLQNILNSNIKLRIKTFSKICEKLNLNQSDYFKY